ncbi:hypothetical protein [Sedimentibacter sp.]|uniref:hypothetical protein n=1 Tax=Sedimentibacter sp. TaxID=1960295 RepID=UPI00289A19B5|nr:hypothetical protein [Sedimentibacter sp.]
MTTKKILKLFISTFLFFILGFVLILIIDNSIEFKSMLFYITTRAFIMILSGVILYFITNWKSLRLKKIFLNVKRHTEYIRYIKLRGLFVAIFTLISIYCSRNGLKNQDFLSPVLDTLNKLFFHKEYEFFVLKYKMVSQSITTLFFTLIMIGTYLFLEFLFTDKIITDDVIDEK